MDKSEAIVSVDDAIRKLVQLSSKEKIWTQEMLLQVNDQALRLLDVESQVRRGRAHARPSSSAGPPRGGGRQAGRTPGAERPGSPVCWTRPPLHEPVQRLARARAWPGPGLRVQQL